jgi:hypothetical protein
LGLTLSSGKHDKVIKKDFALRFAPSSPTLLPVQTGDMGYRCSET